MTARYTTRFKKYIASLVGFFQTRMLLTEYVINIEFSGEPHKDDRSNDLRVHSEIDITDQYLHAKLVIFPASRKEYNDGKWRDLADTICHEIAHLITWPIYNRIPDNLCDADSEKDSDKATQRITNIVLSQMTDDEISPSAFEL